MASMRNHQLFAIIVVGSLTMGRLVASLIAPTLQVPVCVAAAVLFGLVPAIRTARVDVPELAGEGLRRTCASGRTTNGDCSRQRFAGCRCRPI